MRSESLYGIRDRRRQVRKEAKSPACQPCHPAREMSSLSHVAREHALWLECGPELRATLADQRRVLPFPEQPVAMVRAL